VRAGSPPAHDCVVTVRDDALDHHTKIGKADEKVFANAFPLVQRYGRPVGLM
jgi:hypothetical protein